VPVFTALLAKIDIHRFSRSMFETCVQLAVRSRQANLAFRLSPFRLTDNLISREMLRR
jgi:hypothetical protein